MLKNPIFSKKKCNKIVHWHELVMNIHHHIYDTTQNHDSSLRWRDWTLPVMISVQSPNFDLHYKRMVWEPQIRAVPADHVHQSRPILKSSLSGLQTEQQQLKMSWRRTSKCAHLRNKWALKTLSYSLKDTHCTIVLDLQFPCLSEFL